jgi:hypothetical protein
MHIKNEQNNGEKSGLKAALKASSACFCFQLARFFQVPVDTGPDRASLPHRYAGRVWSWNPPTAAQART